MFNVIRIPTKFLKPISRLSKSDKAEIFDLLCSIGAGNSVQLPDNSMGDLLNLIYGEWMNMEARNGKKPKESLIKAYSEGVGTVNPSDSGHRVEESIIEENKVKDITISKDIEAEPVEYGNKQINEILAFLCRAVGVDQFKESQRIQRQYGKHFMSFIEKNGREDFINRVKGIISDDFKLKNCNSLRFLYAEVKAYIHTPLSDNGVKKC